MRARATLVLAFLVGIIGCDHVTKYVAVATLRGHPSRAFLDGLVRLHYTENTGAFLSLGAELPRETRRAVFTLGAGVLLLVLGGLALTRREHGPGESVAVALIMGGGLSNLADRVFRDGHVVDFLQLAVGPLRTGIFNVADVALTLGALMLLAAGLRGPSATME